MLFQNKKFQRIVIGVIAFMLIAMMVLSLFAYAV